MDKLCTKCKAEKDLSEFGNRTRSKDGLFCWCKLCRSKHSKKKYVENKEHINKINAKWKHENAEKHKEINRKYRVDNPDKVKALGQKWYVENRDKRRITIHKWYTENAENVIKRTSKWKADHPEEAKAIRKRTSAKIMRTPQGKLNQSMSRSIGNSLRGLKAGRQWETLVGYTVYDLKAHLEKQFEDGMSWENYGKNGWEIDHKIPKSIFHYECPENVDFKKAWSLKNLQPLWLSANRRKYNKIDRPFQPSLLLREPAYG